MKICMYSYIRGSACSSIIINENLLKDINRELTYYVVAENLSEPPHIETVEDLENLLKKHHDSEYTNDYYILHKGFIEEDGTVSPNAYHEWLYDIVCDMITDALYSEPIELIDYDTEDYEIELKA